MSRSMSKTAQRISGQYVSNSSAANSLNQMPQQSLPFRPLAQPGIAVDVAGRADIHQTASPIVRQLARAIHRTEVIVPAGHDHGGQCQQALRDWPNDLGVARRDLTN